MKYVIDKKDLLEGLAVAFEYGRVTGSEVTGSDKDAYAVHVLKSLRGAGKLKPFGSLTLEDLTKGLGPETYE